MTLTQTDLQRAWAANMLGLSETQVAAVSLSELLRDAYSFPSAKPTIKGAGSPEGVITAPITTRYVDVNAVNGAMEWIKSSGSGNTGWQVVYGDTGWRNLNSLINGSFMTLASGSIKLRRRNDIVDWSLESLTPTANVNLGALPMITTHPIGFRVPSAVAGLIQKGNGLGTAYHLTIISSGVYLMQRALPSVASVWSMGDPLSGFLSYPTNDAWPTVLPGVAA